MAAEGTAQENDSSGNGNRPKSAIDMESHTGLRGVAAVWIVIYHSVLTHIDVQGTSLMPLFFMLSGFVLAVIYGNRPWKLVTSRSLFCCRATGPSDSTGSPATAPPAIISNREEPVKEELCQHFDRSGFYWNRFSRMMPTYYLCVLFAIPLVFTGYHAEIRPETFFSSLMVSIIPVQVFFGNYFGFCLDDPAWFVQTVLAFYFMFPLWLSRAQRQSDEQLVRNLLKWYWVQLALIVAINYAMAPFAMR